MSRKINIELTVVQALDLLTIAKVMSDQLDPENPGNLPTVEAVKDFEEQILLKTTVADMDEAQHIANVYRMLYPPKDY